jgi:hypothetical protein
LPRCEIATTSSFTGMIGLRNRHELRHTRRCKQHLDHLCLRPCIVLDSEQHSGLWSWTPSATNLIPGFRAGCQCTEKNILRGNKRMNEQLMNELLVNELVMHELVRNELIQSNELVRWMIHSILHY